MAQVKTVYDAKPRLWLLVPSVVVFFGGLIHALGKVWLGLPYWPWGATYWLGLAGILVWMRLVARDRQRFYAAERERIAKAWADYQKRKAAEP